MAKFTSQLRQANPSLFSDAQKDTAERIAILAAMTAYRSKLALESSKDGCDGLADQLCVKIMREFESNHQSTPKHRERLACALLRWACVQSDPSQDVVDMKAFLSKWITFNALLGESGLLATSC